MVADELRTSEDLTVVFGLGGERTAHDVSVHVTTGGNGSHESSVDSLHSGLELALDNTVELEGLSCGELHGLVTKLIGNSASDHERVGRLKTLGLSLVSDITVILHVCSVELSELSVRRRDRKSGGVVETLDNGTTEIVGGQLDVFVGDRRGLLRKAIDLVDAKGSPKLGLPLLVASLETVGVLVITKTNVDQVLTAKVSQDSVEILGRLVVVDSVLLARPVVAITKTEDGVVDGSKIKVGAVLDSIPERQTVLGELTLTSGGSDEDDVLLSGEIFKRVVLHGQNRSLQATGTTSASQSLGQGGSITVIRGIQNVLDKGSSELGLLGSKLSKLVVAVKELLKLLLDEFRVEGEVRLTLLLILGVPSVQRPVSGINSLLGLLENSESLKKSLEHLSTDILLATVSISSGPLRVRSRIDDEHVDVLTRGQNVVNTRVAKIVRPRVGTSQPKGLLSEKTLSRKELSGQRRTIGLKSGNDIVSDLSRLGGIISVHSPSCQPALGSIGSEATASCGILHLRNELAAALLASQKGTESELRAGRNVGGKTSSGRLDSVGNGLDNHLRGDITKLVANNSLNATGATLHGSQDINEEGTPLGGLAVDLLKHSNTLNRSRNGIDKSRSDPRSVKARSKDSSIGEDLIGAGLVNCLSKSTSIRAEDEKAVLGIRGS
ncbi:hypothetical protein HG530_006004 [Fusarium avenaceum]|nr:hypothetical protein HG530_006004 [Fusarium avenaceum]